MLKKSTMMAVLALSACGEAAPGPEVSPGSVSQPTTYEQMWATAERVQRRTCASEQCGIVGQLFFRESAHVYETKDGWARVTEPYSASCMDGVSEHVDRGNQACTAANGIVDGEFAEWVSANQLSATRPPDPADTASLDEKLIADSDDFSQHRSAFVRAANQLIREGRCKVEDFEEMGGWWKSSNHRDAPIYFTYCGGMTISNRIYLDASSGRIFQE